MKIFATVSAIIAAGAVAVAVAQPVNFGISLGDVNYTGGTNSTTFAPETVPASGGKITGTIKNGTSAPLADIGICVKRASSSQTPPTSGGAITIGSGGNSTTGGVETSEDGFCTDIDLGDAVGQAKPIATGKTATVSIAIQSAGGGDYQVKISGSNDLAGDGLHADVLMAAPLEYNSPGVMRVMPIPFHPRASMFIIHAGLDSRSESITSFSGHFTLPEKTVLKSVFLRDPKRKFMVVASPSEISDGNSFVISGFSPIAFGESYELLGVFSNTPPNGYKLQLEAGFDAIEED